MVQTPAKPIRLERCLPAARELAYLLERGYPKGSALRFVGDHHQLRQVERDLLLRGVFTRAASRGRRSRALSPSGLRGELLVVDGHNCTITLESGLKGRPFLVGSDGFVRDVSRVFRSFRPTALTREAWGHIISLLRDYPPRRVVVVLDAPLSHSGKLRRQILRWLEEASIPCEALLARRPEARMVELAREGVLATADSVALDRAPRLFDLAGHIIRRRLRLRPLVRFPAP